jgi:hypothetical protein
MMILPYFALSANITPMSADLNKYIVEVQQADYRGQREKLEQLFLEGVRFEKTELPQQWVQRPCGIRRDRICPDESRHPI